MLLVLLKVIFTRKGGDIMEQLILIMLNAGDEPLQAMIQAGLDMVYAYFKAMAEKTDTKLDDKALQIIVNAVHDWNPKNS